MFTLPFSALALSLCASAASALNSKRHASLAQRIKSEQPALRSPVWHGLGRDTNFQITDNCTGSTFFDCFDYFTDADPTHGDVVFVNESDAWSLGLVSTTPTQSFLRVDNSTSLPSGQGRNSVRLGTKKTYDGALFVLDVEHMPFGCATWPAFWTVSQTQPWPLGGEIDIVEGVNLNPLNQMTLHTGPGCAPNTSASDYTGQQLGTTCPSSDGANAGCGFLDRSNTSYGAGLNAAGGGVFAMHWDGGGVSIWHWTHDEQPCDLADLSGSPDPSGWGTPAAAWVANGCSPYTYLTDHQAIIETTLCGDWANSNYAAAGCPGTCSDAVMDPSNFNDAYWQINYFSVFVES
ncbi:glycoside hydrolase family 16 protein [Calocera viscosa TUFC12733]|uniref:Glycoside hydrolase family 16 protein n=1 Tax=Calocera viscosa (strain TUFC12733) TaxID=1330018 RepID=A0A167NE82_CALVF|nr:glycoside hydrolase family 16 protein [Calocera viscosa TUFC12733]